MTGEPVPLDEQRQALLERWQTSEDPDALDELLRVEVGEIARRMRLRAGGMLAPSASASDLAQEAVLRWLRLDERPQFRDPGALRAYLWTAAWRLLLNRVQRPGRDVIRLDATQTGRLSGAFGIVGGSTAVDQTDQSSALELIVNLLKAEDREILSRIYFRGESVEAAALGLGLSRAAVEMRLSRARKRLAEKLVGWADIIG